MGSGRKERMKNNSLPFGLRDGLVVEGQDPEVNKVLVDTA